MGKLRKIVEAKAAVKGVESSLMDKLGAMLNRKELAVLQPELGMFQQACKLLEIKLMQLEPGLKDKAANLPK
jgi:hypothetical protein